MPEPVFTVFRGESPESRKRGQRYTPFSAYQSLVKKEGNLLFKTLDVAISGQYFLAGAAKGIQEGEPRWQAGLRGIANRASFRELEGVNTGTGFAMDVFLDPSNLIPGKLLVGAAGKGVKQTVNAIRRVPGGSRLVNDLGEKFVINYLLKRDDYDGFIRLKNDLYGRLNYARSEEINKWSDDIFEVLPEKTSRETIGKLYDDFPLLSPKESPEYERWYLRYKDLNAEEQEGFTLLKRGLEELSERRRAGKLVSAEQMAGFIRATGRPYIPRYYATKENAISHVSSYRSSLSDRVKSIKLSNKKREMVEKKLAEADKWLDDLENMPETIGPFYKSRIHRYYQSGAEPDFVRKRKHKEAIDDLPEELFKSLETDAAVILDIASRSTTKALHSQKFVADAARYLRKMGLVVPRELAGRDPRTIVTEMQKMGMKIDRRVLSGPLEKIKVDKLQDFMVPKAIADDVNTVLKAYTDPSYQKEVLGAWDASTRWWKAFTLMPFTGYHIRNRLSNIWNMGFDMKPNQYIVHYKPAHKLWWDIYHGTLNGSKYRLGKKTYTDKELMEGALHNRVIGGGEVAGEVGAVYEDAGGILKGILDPKRNPFTKYGYKAGRYIEDTDRLTYWFYRLTKGDTMAEAGEIVRHRLFDYQYGLTSFEQKWFRNRMVPFWAWTKFNLPYALEMLIRHPQRYIRYQKARRTVEDTWAGPEPEEQYLADWLKRSGKMRIWYNPKTETYHYLLFDSWWPGADIGKLHYNRVGREFLNMVTPLVKLIPETIFGYDLFRMRKMERFPGEKGKLAGVELNIPLSKRIEHIARTMRIVNETDRVIQATGREYSTSFGERMFRGALRALVGRPVYPVKYESQIRSWNYRTRKQLGQLKAARAMAVKYGGKRNVEIIDKQIKEVENLREHHLKLPRVESALKKRKKYK